MVPRAPRRAACFSGCAQPMPSLLRRWLWRRPGQATLPVPLALVKHLHLPEHPAADVVQLLLDDLQCREMRPEGSPALQQAHLDPVYTRRPEPAPQRWRTRLA